MRDAAIAAEVVYVALGSNMGDRAAHLAFARAALGTLRDTRVSGASDIEETEPLGMVEQPAFLNQMVRLETSLAPEALLDELQRIEREARRVRTVRWGPRPLDLDIVLFGEQVIDTERLTVPHAELPNRDFWRRELAQLGHPSYVPVTR